MTTKTIMVVALGFLVMASATTTRAEVCGNVSEEGVCQDPKTLLYCQDGELETMDCGVDEICVAHDFFGGSSGCVHTRYTGCGDITEAGTCVGDKLLYCANHKVVERTCDQGWTCGLVSSPAADGGSADYYDCVGQQAIGPTTPDDEEVEPPERIGAEDSAELEATSDPQDNAAPSVEKGGAAALGTDAGGGAGCSGADPGTAALVLAALGLLIGYAKLLASRRKPVRVRKSN